MKKLLALTIEGLKLPQQLAFTQFVLNAVVLYAIIGEKFSKAVSMLKAAYDKQNDLYLRHDRKMLTAQVQEADAARAKWLRKLRNNLREIMEFGAGEKKQAAEFLFTIIEEYGGAKIPDFQMDYETGQLTNLYEDLQQRYADKVELLGLTSVVQGAKRSNDDFILALRKRTQSDAEYGKGAMQEARTETERCYRYLISCVNVEAEVDEEGILSPFIDYMNAEIDRMRKLSGQTPATPGEETAPNLPEETESPESPTPSIPGEGEDEETPNNPDNGNGSGESGELNPSENVTVQWVNRSGRVVKEMVVPKGGSVSLADYPEVDDGWEWSLGWGQVNARLKNAEPGSVITVNEQVYSEV